MRPLSVLLLLLLALACSDDGEVPVSDLGQDGSPGLEAGPDLLKPDLRAPDLRAPDLRPLDLPVPDLPVPDLMQPDQAQPPTNGSCAKAQVLSLAAGKVTVKGDTTLAKNEFGSGVACGGTSPYLGPQVYYKLTLTAGKLYSLKLTPGAGFDPALYALPASVGCTPAGVNLGCKGLVSDVTGKGAAGVETLTLKPTITGDWIVAVDGFSAGEKGPFTLSITEALPAANDQCAKAVVLTLSGGKAAASGDTSLGSNQFGTTVTCGTSYDYDGPQLYYLAPLPANKTYRVTATPKTSWDLAAYAFTDATCTGLTVDKQCAAWFSDSAGAGKAESFIITTTQQQSYILAVDSYAATVHGAFDLKVEEIPVAANGTCSKATPLTLQQGQALVSGDTTAVADEHTGLKCGGVAALAGGQTYHALTAVAGKTYRVALFPDFAARLYIFPAAACGSLAAVETGCASKGISGDRVATTIPAHSGGQLIFQPNTPGAYLVAVDSDNAGAAGAYDLTVSELGLPSFTAPLSWDFDLGCQGLRASGDWECGDLKFKAGKGCEATAKPPAKAHSGNGLWGTRLNDCYSAYGNNAQTGCKATSAADDSVLSFSVTIPAGWTKATLRYWQWDDSLTPDDWSEVRLDGAPVAATQTCAKTFTAPTAWAQRSVDLSAYVAKTVTVAFHFSASAAKNHSGWYLDDLVIDNK